MVFQLWYAEIEKFVGMCDQCNCNAIRLVGDKNSRQSEMRVQSEQGGPRYRSACYISVSRGMVLIPREIHVMGKEDAMPATRVQEVMSSL